MDAPHLGNVGLDKGRRPKDAVRAYLEGHPEVLEGWLDGVTAFEGEPGLPVVRQELGLS